MRTANPTNIRLDFVDGITDVEAALVDVLGNSVQTKTKLHAVEYSFLAACVLLEGFIGDLFVAYINRDNSEFLAYMESKMKIETVDDVSKRAKPLASIKIKAHLTLLEISKLLDPNGYNVAFPHSNEMKAKAGQWLAGAYKASFLGLSPAQYALLDATKAMRNYLAHRSSASSATMQAQLVTATLPAFIKRGTNNVNSVGSFLFSAHTAGGPARYLSYFQEARSIAAALCP